VSSKYQSTQFVAPKKYTVSVNTNVKGASATCFETSVPSTEGQNVILKYEFHLGNLYI